LANCSLEGKNLILKILKFDPLKRLSASHALKHKWFLDFVVTSEQDLDKDFITDCYNNILNYSFEKKFQLAIVSYMIHNVMAKEEMKDLKILFEIFNVNKKGKLKYEDIIYGFKNLLGEIKNEKEFLKRLKKIDSEKFGYLNYDKFLIAAINKDNLIQEEKLYLTFRLFDKEDLGFIYIEELKTLLSISTKGTEKAWTEIFEQNQNLIDLEITFSAFKDLMFGLKMKNTPQSVDTLKSKNSNGHFDN